MKLKTQMLLKTKVEFIILYALFFGKTVFLSLPTVAETNMDF